MFLCFAFNIDWQGMHGTSYQPSPAPTIRVVSSNIGNEHVDITSAGLRKSFNVNVRLL